MAMTEYEKIIAEGVYNPEIDGDLSSRNFKRQIVY